MGRRKFSDEQEQLICNRYAEGESTRRLGEAFDANNVTISSILKRRRIERRSKSIANGGLGPEGEARVCRRYAEGENTSQLSAAFEVDAKTIRNILKRHNVERRSPNVARGGLPTEAEPEVCRRYAKGENTYQLAAAFGVSPNTIRRALKRKGIALRAFSVAQGGLPTEAEPEVCRRYLAGESTVQLSSAFEVSSVTIGNILERNGVGRRSLSMAQGGLPTEAEPEVCRRYLAGESTVHLGEAFGVSSNTIGLILKRNGVRLRGRAGFGDSIQHALSNTGRHALARNCEFYLFELKRYSDTHCKPGIAYNTDRRVTVGAGEYGAEVLRLLFATRREAYLLEQAVLHHTRNCADCPDDLWDWTGASEVRAMPASEMVPIVERLAEELDELDEWEFAARYVPMTAAQRLACQQRALLSPDNLRPTADQCRTDGSSR